MWLFRGQNKPPFADQPLDGQESVWDYPRPPVCVEDVRVVRVECEGVLLAETSRAVRVLETASPPTFYIPPDDVRMEAFKSVSGQSFCEWKGAATYYSLVEPMAIKHVGWSYPTPTDRFAQIAGYIAFYPGKLSCFVGGERVRPQPGGFYGGWVTDEIVGPYKGETGTLGW